jgi:hypothetical protein
MVVSKCEQRPGCFGVTLLLQGVTSVFLADKGRPPPTSRLASLVTKVGTLKGGC